MLNAGIHAAYRSGLERLEHHAGVEIIAKAQASTGVNGAAAAVLKVPAAQFIADESLQEEVFGPSSLVVVGRGADDLYRIVEQLHGQLTATVYGTGADFLAFPDLLDQLAQKAGRLLFGGFPTGVEVCDAMVHGGPYPATTDARSTSVGTAAIFRFVRPVAFQNFPDHLLPEALRDGNPLEIRRRVDGKWV